MTEGILVRRHDRISSRMLYLTVGKEFLIQFVSDVGSCGQRRNQVHMVRSTSRA